MANWAGAAQRQYVRAARGFRTLARTTGVLDHLDARYRVAPRSFRGHLRTLLSIHDVDDMVTLDTPWWSYGAIDAVVEHLERLQGTAKVFEYGSGASTVWLAARSAQVVTVEHDARFAELLRGILDASGLLARTQVLEVTPTPSAEPETASRRRGEGGLDFTEYVRAIDGAGGPYDLIVVDGRVRVACLEAALEHLAPGGLVVVDDAQRPRYRAGVMAAGLPVRRFWGWVPALPYPRMTAVLG